MKSNVATDFVTTMMLQHYSVFTRFGQYEDDWLPWPFVPSSWPSHNIKRFTNLNENKFKKCFQTWNKRLQNYMRANGMYFELENKSEMKKFLLSSLHKSILLCIKIVLSYLLTSLNGTSPKITGLFNGEYLVSLS